MKFLARRHWRASLGLGLVLLWLLTGTGPVDAASHNPQSGQAEIQAVVPSTPPKILQPGSGQRFSQSPITVSGQCQNSTVVEIYKNRIFGGSASCVNGQFSLEVALLVGQNNLVARARAVDGTYGPDSATVTVYYDPISPVTPGQQFILVTDGLYFGVEVDQTLVITVDIIGGTAPYLIYVDWGDGQDDLLSRAQSGEFTVNHVYELSGVYQIRISGTAAKGQRAFVQTTAVVSGQPADSEGPSLTQGAWWLRLLNNWLFQTIGLTALTIFSFWFGYHWALRVLRQQTSTKANQPVAATKSPTAAPKPLTKPPKRS